MKRYLVEFDFGLRDAFGKSLEVLTEEEYNKVKEFSQAGKEVYLGEISGKHSEVYGPLDSTDFKILSSDEKEISSFEKIIGKHFGAFHMLGSVEDALNEE